MIVALGTAGLRSVAGFAVAAAHTAARGQAVLAADTTPAPQDIDPTTGHGPEWGKAAPIGLLVIVLLCIAGYFLARSMNRHLKRVPTSFVAGSAGAPAGAAAAGTPLAGTQLAGAELGGTKAAGTRPGGTQPDGAQPAGPSTAHVTGPPPAHGGVSAARRGIGEQGSDDSGAPAALSGTAVPEPEESPPAAARGSAEQG